MYFFVLAFFFLGVSFARVPPAYFRSPSSFPLSTSLFSECFLSLSISSSYPFSFTPVPSALLCLSSSSCFVSFPDSAVCVTLFVTSLCFLTLGFYPSCPTHPCSYFESGWCTVSETSCQCPYTLSSHRCPLGFAPKAMAPRPCSSSLVCLLYSCSPSWQARAPHRR